MSQLSETREFLRWVNPGSIDVEMQSNAAMSERLYDANEELEQFEDANSAHGSNEAERREDAAIEAHTNEMLAFNQ